MNAVPISWNSNGRSVEAGTPVKLFQAKIGTSGLDALQRQYEVSADGQRFLMDVPIDGPPSPIMAIQNWRP
jgi:hypothetical protein